MLKEDRSTFFSLSDPQAMGLTMYLEARGEGTIGQLAVGWVIKNRADNPRWWGTNIKQVCYHKAQFSCYNDYDPNYEKGLHIATTFERSRVIDETLDTCYRLAEQVIDDGLPDPTRGATYYANLRVCKPTWKDSMTQTAQIRHHTFFKETTI
jgi:N-acetylmuramoyl-L-alanine amidase